jgi:aryl carrier-like protein
MAEREPGSLFAQHSASGLDYGPSFRHVVGRWQGDAETLALIDADVAAPGDDPYVLHPVVLETCLLSAMPLIADRGGLWLPSSLARLSLYRGLPPRLWCHARLAGGGPVDLVLFSDSGEPLVTIDGLTFRAAGTDEFASRPATSAEPDVAGSWDADELSRLVLDQPEAARRVLLGILFERVTALLDVPPDDAESLREEFGRARLSELGLDSLRMMRLRDQLRALLCVDVPPQRLLGDATAADIVDLVCRFLATRNLVMTGDEQLDAAGQAEELVL